MKIARTFHEAWTHRDPGRGASVIAPEPWVIAFPDGVVEITNIIASGEWVVVEFTNRGTNTGPLRTPIGDFSPTGRHAEASYCSVMKITNGKVVAGRDYYDTSTILRQLGLLPDAGGSTP